ncbi:MAG: hypothetical protein HY652_07630 [Acidobacteria bacterium]|nr:hypothetical protein [Acidobacteriota bacterium]
MLIIGAGTGNDARIALDHGAEYIDVVEIDPVILRWGQEIHPNRPYSDRRVHLHVNDARNFLQNTPRKYDLVIFGTLDSQTLLSALSTIRLDNYVYTVESLAQAKAILKPSGALVLGGQGLDREPTGAYRRGCLRLSTRGPSPRRATLV